MVKDGVRLQKQVITNDKLEKFRLNILRCANCDTALL